MKLFLVLLLLLSPTPAFAAPFLACDLPPTDTTVTQCQVEIVSGTSTTYQTGVCRANATSTSFILLDLGTLSGGAKFTFRARWADASGWWSDFSGPFTATKSSTPGALRIVNTQ